MRVQVPMTDEPFHHWAFPDGEHWTDFHRTNGGYLLRFPSLADFAISADGADVECFPVPEVSESTSKHLYLNQVLPLVLSKQGKLVFHASAVDVAHGAIAFVAESGRGKSTLAASFATAGFGFLTDDGLVVDTTAQSFRALPGHPSLRLWDDSRQALISADATSAPAVDYTSKARILADGDLAFCDRPRPLRRAYFLGDGSASRVTFQPIGAAAALVEWVKHSFLLDVEETSRLASHFRQVSELVRQPIHYRLDYPRRFDQLPAVRQAILDHAGEEDG
jgi:hypothetical protein